MDFAVNDICLCDRGSVEMNASSKAIESATAVMKKMLGAGQKPFDLIIGSPKGTMKVEWRTNGSAAGVIYWLDAATESCLATTIVCSGLNPMADHEAYEVLSKSVPIPADALARIADMKKPFISTLYLTTRAISELLVLASAVGFGRALFGPIRDQPPPGGTVISNTRM